MPIELNGQTVGDITLNGNTIGEVIVNNQVVYTSVVAPPPTPSVVENNAIHDWPFDDGGSTITDIKGGFNLTVNGNANYISGSQFVGGLAADFDSSTWAERNQDITVMTNEQPFSIEMWLDVPTSQNTRDGLMYHDNGSGIQRCTITIDEDNIAFHYLADANYKGGKIPSGLFQIILTFDGGSTTETYINSIQQAPSNVNTNFSSPKGDIFQIGRYYDSVSVPKVIDQCRIYDIELSQSQVDELYNFHPST